MRRFKLLPLAGLLAIGLSVAGSAHAGSYALSSDFIQNFAVIGGTNITFTSSIDTSSTGAILNGGNSGILGGVGVSDAPVAVAPGSTPAGALQFSNNGAFPAAANLPLGPVASSNYSYADGLITHSGTTFNARTIAESHLSTTGTASGTATNSSASGFTSNFIATGTGGQIAFSFLADPLIQTFLQLGGSFAQGTLSASLTISCQTVNGCAPGTTVFGWAPNGVVDAPTGSVGGVESADSQNLNLSLSQDVVTAAGLVYSPGAVFTSFAARTNNLVAGTYTLTLAMTSTDAVIKKVPEPGTLVLAGLGLGMLGFVGRRRRQVR